MRAERARYPSEEKPQKQQNTEVNIEDKNLLPSLRKILSNLKGVTIARTQTVKKGTLSKAVDEVRSGKVTRVATVAELMAELDS